jgi:hypothetical protein
MPEKESAEHDQALWPIDPTTGRPLAPRSQPGYYPGYHTLGQQRFWDEATRETVLRRVRDVPPIRFFSPDEERIMRAVCDRILPQDDRDHGHKIPIINYIDERLYSGRIDGYRYENMPPDGEAHRLGLKAIDEIAEYLHRKPFVDLPPWQQEEVLETIRQGEPPAGQAIWEQMNVQRYWSLLQQDAVEAYYAHPFAWDEIGFGGPAYPRGYMRQEQGLPEPWEVDEQRYPWAPPPLSVSGIDTTPEWKEAHPHREQPAVGQEGTH